MIIKNELGKIYEGRFKVVDIKKEGKRYFFFLQNIYNNQVVKLEYTSMVRINNGTTTISKIIYSRIMKEKRGDVRKWK